jgi:pimeloyl-ACP methyl ester carboxylesterase
MPAVLLHGNPETPIIWEPLVAHLARTDVICPNLPGFGCPSPVGFGATKEEYVAWLIGELEPIVAASGPVDFVGHDWGGGIGMRAVATRPELFRSWACDVLGLFHPEYVWHDFAQIWQTPGAGEDYFAQTMATPVEDRIALYKSIGIPRPIGERLVALADDEMSRCILALYRSAAQPAMVEWGRELAAASTVPGLAITAPDDPFVRSTDLGPAIGAQLGAREHVMSGQGHWWMLGDPATGANVLEAFWASL